MRRFGRVFCCLAISVLAGGLAAPPAAGQVVSDLWFDEPHDGATWHRGDVIRARIVPALAIPGAGSSRPKLELVVGDKTHEVEGRFYQNGRRAQFYYTVRSDDAAAAVDGVGIPANAISGGSIREADGSRAADTSHPMQDPSRDLQADATRQVACAAVPVAPAPGLALLASLLLAAGATSGPAAPPRLNARGRRDGRILR